MLAEQRSEPFSTNAEIAARLWDFTRGGAVIVCSLSTDSEDVVPARLSVRAATVALQGHFEAISRRVSPDPAYFASPETSIMRRLTPVKPCHPLSWSHLLGEDSAELQCLAFCPETHEALAWIIVLETPLTTPLDSSFRKRLPLARSSIQSCIDRIPRRPSRAPTPTGWLVVDQGAGILHHSPGATTLVSGVNEVLSNVSLRLEGDDAFLACHEGHVLRFEPMVGSGAKWLVRVHPELPVVRNPLSLLTPVQRRVADYAIAGATSTEIARTMKCSVETTRTHLRAIYRRLDIACRTELVHVGRSLK